MPTSAPYGSWRSPITAELITRGGSDLRWLTASGELLYWLEGRPHEGGRDVLVRQKAEGVRRKLCCLALADPLAIALGGEPVRADERIAGRVTSGGFGYSVGLSIAYAYLPVELATPGTPVAVEVFGDWIDGLVAAEPLWDPKGERVRS